MIQSLSYGASNPSIADRRRSTYRPFYVETQFEIEQQLKTLYLLAEPCPQATDDALAESYRPEKELRRYK